ncbi:MAG TPA: hypothetical protein VGJ26_01590 [Pirellulales bacterium]
MGPHIEKDDLIPKLAISDVAISFKVSKTDATGLPEAIQIHFSNSTAETGAFELPGPILGDSAQEGRPQIALRTSIPEEFNVDLFQAGYFARQPPEASLPKQDSVAVLRPNGSITVDYALAEFRLITKNDSPKAETTFRSLYRAGAVKTELRVLLMYPLEPMARKESSPVVVPLSRPNFSTELDQSKMLSAKDIETMLNQSYLENAEP